MKSMGMRNALFAAGTLAALTGTASAQTISPTAGEFIYQGQFVQNPATAASAPTTTAATRPFVIDQVAGIGFFGGGAIFQGLTGLETRVGTTERNSNYTFDLFGLVRNTAAGPDMSAGAKNLAPGVVAFGGTVGPTFTGALFTTFVGGTLNIYRDDNLANDNDPTAVSGSRQSFRTDVPNPTNNTTTTSPNYTTARGNFRDGTLVLSASIPILRTSVSFVNGAPIAGSIINSGMVINSGSGSIYNFLVANNLRAGIIGGDFAFGGTRGPVTGYRLRVDGSIDIVPEPTTMALFGAGLLPLGAFLRRRRGV